MNILHVREVFFSLCKSVDSPVSLGCWLRFEHSHVELANMTINPRDYNDHFSFSRDYACVSFLSKGKMLDTGLDLDAEALRKFTKSEDLCRSTNRYLVSEIGSRTRFEPYIHTARRKISKLLGAFSMEKVRDHCGWGPGASTDLRRKEAQLDRKMCELPIPVTRTCLDSFKRELEGDLHWSSSILNTVPEGPFSLLFQNFIINEDCRVETVPKNAKTNRVIAIENRGNSFLQKGVGGFIRKRLRRVGVDLDNQEVNQHWALRAYEDKLATLDLKAASDTISTEAVWLLLPYEWVEYLNSIRSRFATLPDGTRVKLEKFSSMGNGFTFELESLIFWALAQSVSDLGSGQLVSIYGDDIICSQQDSHELILLLNHVGFEVNTDKSFTEGCFFESCGKHFFQGRECTPAYQKDNISDDLTAARCANRLLRLGYRLSNGMSFDPIVRGAFESLWRKRSVDAYIPFSLTGDDGWSVPRRYFPTSIPFRSRNWVGSFRCPVFKPREKQFPAHEPSLLAWSLRRGVVTEIPYLGTIITSDDGTPTISYRQVVPDGKFELDWD
jgi:hypothetical protein